MPQPGEPGSRGIWEPATPDSDEAETLPDLLGPELAHLFDYCRALLGQDAEAARTARSVLDSAHEPVPDRDRNRAWLFALARRQAMELRSSSSAEPSYLPPALMVASSQETATAVLRAFGALTDDDREIVDLVYRHGIQPADLATVLAVPAEETYRRLVNAEEELISLAAGPKARPGAGLEEIAALPLADVPPPEDEPDLGPEPPGHRDRAALWRVIANSVDVATRGIAAAKSSPRRARIAAAVIPVAAIVWALVYLAAPGHSAASQGGAAMPRGSGSQHSGRSAKATHGSATGHQGHLGMPRASQAPAAVPTPASTPAGLAVIVQTVPCPSGTKANVRWHYTANGSPGGWSGTATHSCPGSLTMGPQAMGNLQVTPGTTLQAGYDVTVAGNKSLLTMTVSAAQVTMAVSCVSKTAPSAPTLTVPLQTQTYQITSDQWFPSGDQASPLVYQGSVSVPALCGPGGAISLAKGGTFTATLG